MGGRCSRINYVDKKRRKRQGEQGRVPITALSELPEHQHAHDGQWKDRPEEGPHQLGIA